MPRKNTKTQKRAQPLPLRQHARVAVVVPQGDTGLVKQLAKRLREATPEADRIRKAIAAAVAPQVARTGKDLLALLRDSPLQCVTLDLERDRTPPDEVDL